MNYIGSKLKLSQFLLQTIRAIAGEDLSRMVFCDAFAGTGAMGRVFKPLVKKVIANDMEYYAYVLNKNYVGNTVLLPDSSARLEQANALPLMEDGFIYKNYCLGGHGERQYFSDYNGKKTDAIRTQIEKWFQGGEINENMYFFLLASLLESIDSLANTASVYGAYLKKLKKSAQRQLYVEPAMFAETEQKNEVFNEDINHLISKIGGDILYLDPPYNARQYGANYHLLNTIAEYKPFTPTGKTGLREYKPSRWCSRKTVLDEFDYLLKNARFKYVFLSYNNEGLMSPEEIRQIMERYGKYDLITTDYQRFKADKDANRNIKAQTTTEYLHILQTI